MDTRRSFYLAPGQDDLAERAQSAGRLGCDSIAAIAANDNSLVKDRLSARCGALLRHLIGLHILTRPN